MVLALHLGLASICFFTMDTDLGSGGLRAFLNYCIDAYEVVGFGEMAIGFGIVTALLGASLLASFRAKRNLPDEAS